MYYIVELVNCEEINQTNKQTNNRQTNKDEKIIVTVRL